MEPLRPALVPAQRTNHHGGNAGLGNGLLHPHGQHGVRADLHERVVPGGQQTGHGWFEQHGLTQVGEPVLGVQLPGVQPVGVHSGHERDLTGSGPDRGEFGQQPVPDPVDVRRVRRVVHRDPPGAHVLGRAVREQLVQCARRTGHHH